MCECAHHIEVLNHRIAKTGEFWPPVHLIGCGRIDKIEYFLVITHSLREFTVEPTQWVLFVSHDCGTDRPRSIKEALGGDPGIGDDVIETMARKEKKSVVATGCIERLAGSGTGSRDVNNGNGGHVPLWPDRVLVRLRQCRPVVLGSVYGSSFSDS
ncbi:unannotated protein [freshwater metagenome]|uniref:Unannotated protein n=1 Tax=freshwater metagenome TaxID=449393 RepID=A0A6J6ZBU0_9ZZZZ